MPIIMFKILNFGMKTLLFEQEPGIQIEITDSDFPLQYFELFFYVILYLMKQKKYADQFLANKQMEKKSCFKKMEIFNSFRDDEVIRSCCFSNGNHYTNRYFRKLDRKSNEINSPVINV